MFIRPLRRLARITSAALAAALVLGTFPATAYAVSSWSPTLLVNTESFETIDAGDGTTNIELRFGASTKTIKFLTTNKFQFSHSISVIGGLSGSYLTVDGNANVSGALLVKSSITTRSTLSGAALRISGPGEVFGNLTASGSFRTDSNITINDDADTNDGILTFGNTSGNQTIKFLNTLQRFEFSRSIRVLGTISGSSLRVDGNATIGGPLTVTGSIRTKSALSGASLNVDGTTMLYGAVTGNTSITAKGTLSGTTLRTSGNADIQGNLALTGSLRTDSNITINDDADTNDATLTFGNTSGNQTLKFLNTLQRFEFSRSIRVLGTISGSSLRVDGNATIGGPLTVTGAIRTKGNLSGSSLTVDGGLNLHGVSYTIQGSQGGANTFLRNDGAGALTWASAAVGNGSGMIMSLHPEYPNAIYFASGSTSVGQLTMSGGTADLDNSYQWTTSRGTLQDYWIAVRERLPDNFSTWDPIKPIQFRFKTGVAGGQLNHLTLRIRDTAGALYNLTGGLVGTSFTTAIVPGTNSAFAGTWTPKGYFTTYIKMAATSTTNAAAYASFLNFNFESTTP
jgi:cytoskeletal protein CcmA (bactofilin family)